MTGSFSVIGPEDAVSGISWVEAAAVAARLRRARAARAAVIRPLEPSSRAGPWSLRRGVAAVSRRSRGTSSAAPPSGRMTMWKRLSVGGLMGVLRGDLDRNEPPNDHGNRLEGAMSGFIFRPARS